MAATKKVAKKATKRTTKINLPEVMWVVSERKLMTWTPLIAFATQESARHQANVLDAQSGLSFNKFKVDRVVVGN